jgi:hypothetical protein
MAETVAEQICRAIVAPNPQPFRRLARHVSDLDAGQCALLVTSTAEGLANSDIGVTEQAQRMRLLAQCLPQEPEIFGKVAKAARFLSDSLKNAIASVLPSEFRPILYGNSSVIPLIRRDVRPSRSSTQMTAALTASRSAIETYTTVLLLAKADQLSNCKLLKGHGFAPIVYDDIGRLHTDLAGNADICGFVVDESFLQALDAERQRRLLRELGEYSTFAWLRVDERGLQISAPDVHELVKRAQCACRPVAARQLSIQPDGDLRESELAFLKKASGSLRTGDRTHFVPGELDDGEASILMAAARRHAEELRFDGEIVVTSLRTEFLQGERDVARVAIIRANKNGMPVVAKIHRKPDILREIERFRIFIQEWDDQLHPVACLHGSIGVIIFGLIPDPQNPTRPAPVLDQRLSDLWNSELGFPLACAPPDEGDLRLGLESTVSSLARLNQRLNTRTDIRSWVNPDMRCFQVLENNGTDWGLGDLANGARQVAEGWCRKLATSAVVHGDLHLRNIVLRGDRDAHLIDYAASGPGHPAIDLVRLELALLTGWVKQFMNEGRCQDFQTRFTKDQASLVDLTAQFPELFSSRVNRVCLFGCAQARDAALNVLAAYGGGRKDYLACKYLVAWQNLLMDGRQTAWARATISALSNLVLEECAE